MPPDPYAIKQPRTRWGQRNVMQQKATRRRRRQNKAAKLARQKGRK